MDTESRRKSVERFNRRNRLVTKWGHPKPFCNTPFGQKATLEIFLDPLADFLAGKLPDKPHKAPTFLRPLIADLDDYKTLALMVLSPLLDCMTWDRDDPSAAARLKLKIGSEMESQLAFIAPWSEGERLRAGNWLLMQALGLDLFTIEDGFPTISPRWLPDLDRLREEMIRAHPVHMPLFDQPPDWCGWWTKLPNGFGAKFVSDWRPETRTAITTAFLDPEWEHSRGVNSLQNVPFKIDTEMLELVKEFGVLVMGHSGQKRFDDERTIADDISTARYIGDRTFKIPRRCDKRGRVNSVCHFNFDRGDHIRALFRFSRGMHLDPDEGTQWLEVNCANTHGETAKRRWEERINWVGRNRELIQKIADNPKSTIDEWKDTDSPFCFVAACRELAAAWSNPLHFQTHLPIGFDGSCNGLQHLALIARDPETARLVNIGPNSDGTWPHEPLDIYESVIAQVNELLKADDDPWATWWLSRLDELGNKKTRKLIKTPAMTFAYSATHGGMRDQIKEVYENFADQIPRDETRPKGRQDGCSYLAGKVMQACQLLLKEPTKVMEYIQQLARHRMGRGLFLEWTTPAGFPVSNRYQHSKEKTYNLFNGGVRVRHDIVDGVTHQIKKTKTINSAPANFVHSMDAAHLVKVVNASFKTYIRDIVTTHDCYYCLAPVATGFNQIIRWELFAMYKNFDALAHLRNQNVDHDIFPSPPLGALNPLAVCSSETAFA